MAFKTANTLDVSYDNKAYGNLISPTEWNANFLKIEEVANANASDINDNFTALASSGGTAEIGTPALTDLGETEGETSLVSTQLAALASGLSGKESTTDLTTKLNGLVKSVTYAEGTGTFTITFYNDTTTTIDTVIEKVPASMSLVEVGNITYLRITNQDGSYTQTDVTTLINTYTFTDGNTIDFTTDGYSVTAEIKDGSITDDKLGSALISTLEGYATTASTAASTATTKANDASTSANNASASASTATTKAAEASSSASSASSSATTATTSATSSQSWAVGGTGTREGEDTNNAKYWSEQAEAVSGQGLMTKLVYDTDDDGVVDNAEKLNGHDDTYFATSNHNHDEVYASLTHNHNDAYSPLTHNHDSSYANLVHSHDNYALQADLTAEATARQTADAALQGSITSFNTAVSNIPSTAEDITLSTNTATLYGLTGTNANVDNALEKAYLTPTSSYIAFCANVNTNSLDAAFGKNNEEMITGLGLQLAMYAWFKGDSRTTYPFTNLITCNTLQQIAENASAKAEVENNSNLQMLFLSSPYAFSIIPISVWIFKDGVFNPLFGTVTIVNSDASKYKMEIVNNMLKITVASGNNTTARLVGVGGASIDYSQYFTKVNFKIGETFTYTQRMWERAGYPNGVEAGSIHGASGTVISSNIRTGTGELGLNFNNPGVSAGATLSEIYLS